MFLADAVDEQLDLAALRTGIHVELLALHEELAQFAQHAPVATFMEVLRAEVFQIRVTSKAFDGCNAHGHLR